MPTSANGWRVATDPDSLVPFPWVTGRILGGDVYKIFNYLCRRFDAEVEPIRQDWSWGYAYRPIRGSSGGYSNHASGTAIDLNAPKHPLGKRGTFTPHQMAHIDGILGDLQGVVRWGGDYRNRADEMHFEINASRGAVTAVAAALNNEEDDMALSDDDKQWIRNVVRNAVHEGNEEQMGWDVGGGFTVRSALRVAANNAAAAARRLARTGDDSSGEQ